MWGSSSLCRWSRLTLTSTCEIWRFIGWLSGTGTGTRRRKAAWVFSSFMIFGYSFFIIFVPRSGAVMRGFVIIPDGRVSKCTFYAIYF
jgi:hypothetical protein